MNKNYEKPDVEFISFLAVEAITGNLDLEDPDLDGDTGFESGW